MRLGATNTLIAACAAATLAASAAPAAAYQSWGLFGPVAQPQPEPFYAPVRRPSKQTKARKYIADQINVPEKQPPGPMQIVISIR